MDDRVKYYPPTDMLFGRNLSKIERLQVPKFESISINDAIEFFQIKKYFDTGTRAKCWSDDDYAEYKSKCEALSGLTKRFFNQITDNNIIDTYGEINFKYRSDFWVLFDNCKLFWKLLFYERKSKRSSHGEKRGCAKSQFWYKNVYF